MTTSPRLDETPSSAGETRRRRFAVPMAGLLIFCAGAAILMGIITAEALYPEVYTTHENEISDLGATRPPDSVTHQPSAAIFNVTMIASGTMLLASGVLLHRAFGARRVTVSMLVLGAGTAGVGIFPGGYEVAHVVAAATTFTASGVTAILSAHVQRGWLRYASMTLGAITLGSLIFLVVGESTRVFEEMGPGGVERWVAYPGVLWLVAFGGYLMGAPASGERA